VAAVPIASQTRIKKKTKKNGSIHMRFVVDKVALGQIFSEYFGFPCQSSFHQFIHNHPHLSSILFYYRNTTKKMHMPQKCKTINA
jgi:hypothetical protein